MKNGSTLSWQTIVPNYLPLHFCPLKTGLQGLSKGTVLIIDHGNWVNTFEKTTRVNLIAVSISNKLILTEIVPFVRVRSRHLPQNFCPAKNFDASLLSWTRPLLNWNHPSQVDGHWSGICKVQEVWGMRISSKIVLNPQSLFHQILWTSVTLNSLAILRLI